MPRNSTTGAYTAPSNSVNPAVDNEIISAPDFNDLRDDIATALAHADATARALYPTLGQIQDGKPTWGGTATGTTSAIVVTLTPVPTAIVAGMPVNFIMGASANATSATLDIGITSGAPPVAVTYPIRRKDGSAIQAGDLAANALVNLECDGTGFRVAGVVQGDIRQTLGTTVRTTDATLVNADNAYVQDCTAAVTLTLDQASALTAGWWSYVRNNSTSAVTLRGYRAADQAVNGDFAGGTTGWTLGTGWSVGTTGVATAASAAISQAQTLTVGALYEVTYTVVTATAGTVTLQLTGGTTVSGTARSTAGTYTEYLRAVTGNATLGLLGAAFTGSVDNISVRKVEEIDGEATVTIIPGTMPLVWCDGTTSRLSPVSSNGNATVTSGATSITLTNTSARVQSVTMTAAGQSVTLPAATTLTLGGPLYVIHNAGDRPFGVRSSGGALLAVVAAGGVADCYLESIATAAGQWAISGRGLEPALTLVDNTFSSTYTTAKEPACKLTDTLSLHFLSSGTGSYAVAVDSTPGSSSVGTPTVFDAATTNGPSHCFRISDTQAIVFWTDGTNHKAAVLTVSGTSVSVSTSVTAPAGTLANVTFTGAPMIAQLTSTLYVAFYSGTTALVISVSGTAIALGAAASIGATSGVGGSACYAISATTALAIYMDDSGTAGTPYSIRGVVLSVSGTTITAGTSAGVNDVAATGVILPSCQLSATSYIVGYYQNSGTLIRTVAVTVSGTAVTFGTPLTVETAALADNTYTDYTASRFQPNLYPIDSTRALFTYGAGATTTIVRHVILSNSAGVLSAGSILYGLFPGTTGGNFPQAPAGFLAFSTADGEQAVFGVTISGTTLAVTGTFARGEVAINGGLTNRFGLSGGVCGAMQSSASTASSSRYSQINLFRFRGGATPQYLGPVMLNDIGSSAGLKLPVEITANKAAFISGTALSQPSASVTTTVRLLIVEFAA